LRVQLAWWHAGLKQRVFDFYLQGADRELARVREGVRNLVTMAELSASGAGSHTDWKQVFDLGDRKPLPAGGHIADHPRDWIGSQLAYFELRHRQREARHRFTEALSWILFLTSGLLSVLLLCGLWLGKRHMLPPVLASEHADPVGATALVVGSIAFASACWWGFAKARPTPDPVVRIGLATVFGLFAAIALGVALRSMAVTASDPHWLAPALLVSGMVYGGYWVARVLPDVNRTHPAKTAAAMGAILMTTLGLLAVASRFSDHFGHHPNTDLLTEYMAILVIAFLPALAGALRFVSEKMAVEAEALSYRDALGWFEKAARLLTEARPGQGHPEADARARGIVLHLGKLALQESQQWLKSRRERPLTPLIGG
jgi:putative Mn2+ efflux pump MntP